MYYECFWSSIQKSFCPTRTWRSDGPPRLDARHSDALRSPTRASGSCSRTSRSARYAGEGHRVRSQRRGRQIPDPHRPCAESLSRDHRARRGGQLARRRDCLRGVPLERLNCSEFGPSGATLRYLLMSRLVSAARANVLSGALCGVSRSVASVRRATAAADRSPTLQVAANQLLVDRRRRRIDFREC